MEAIIFPGLPRERSLESLTVDFHVSQHTVSMGTLSTRAAPHACTIIQGSNVSGQLAMSKNDYRVLFRPAIRIAATGLGGAVAGPLGGLLGGFLGDVVGHFGEEASKKLLETGAESLAERLKKSAPNLDSLYRESLRLSLARIRPLTEPALTGSPRTQAP
jgi:hypothetical protein